MYELNLGRCNVSLLTATHDDFEARNGATIPPGIYRVTLEAVGQKGYANGIQLERQYGNIRSREGATEIDHNGGTFRFGNRKLFAHSWIEHTNPKAAAAGKAQIVREAAALGVMQKPEKGETGELSFDSWEEDGNGIAGGGGLVKMGLETRRAHT